EHCNVRVGWSCPLSQAGQSSFRRPPVRAARCGSVVRLVLRGVASAFIPMKPCWRSCVNANGHHKGAQSGASAARWSMLWPTLDIGKAAVPAIAACGKMCLICGDGLLCITCTCERAWQSRNVRQHEYSTDALVLLR